MDDAQNLPQSWLGSHQSDPAAIRFAQESGLVDVDGYPLDGLAYYRALTDDVRVWSRAFGAWRSVALVPDGMKPLYYDPATRSVSFLAGSRLIPAPLKLRDSSQQR